LSFRTSLGIQLTPSSRSIIIIIHEHKGGGRPHGWKENLGAFLFVFLNPFGNPTNSLLKKHHHHHHHHPWTQRVGLLMDEKKIWDPFLFVFLNLLGINQTLSLSSMDEWGKPLSFPPPPLLLFVPFKLQELQAWPGPPQLQKLWL
jgi:hypothetical protein